MKKLMQYTTLATQEEAKTRKKVYWSDLAFNHIATFLKSYLIKQGFRDGIHGLIAGVLAAKYTFVRYAKLWEVSAGEKKR